MLDHFKSFSAVIVVAIVFGVAASAGAEDASVTAIDIALEPDATMVDHATAANARLRSIDADGFQLDATHNPHISLLQRYVNTTDLDKVFAAVDALVAQSAAAGTDLKAFKYYYIPWGDIGLGGIVVDPTDALLKLQADIIAAVAPFTVATGTADAFLSDSGGSDIVTPLIDYVADFVPEASGDKFNPHVTIGLAPKTYLDTMLAEPFETFTFSSVGLSVYQLGEFGTARKELKGWDFPS